MNDFSYVVPTKVIFGRDALSNLQEELAKYKPESVLVLYGSGSVIKNGVLDKVTKELENANISYFKHGGVKANPMLSFTYETIKLSRENNVDFVLAVGGGSVIDTAKVVAHGVANPDIDVWDFFTQAQKVEKTIPMATILTISAAGSETSNSAVLTNDETKVKRGLSTEFNRPLFCILNPEFTFTVPKYQIACGVVDILMHTFDRYFSKDYDNELTNQMAEGLMRTMFMYGKQGVENPTDYQAMSEIMWCGSVSHNGLTGLGNITDFSPHQLSHGLSGVYDTAHGAALSICWSGFADYCYKFDVPRFARYARNVFGLEGEDEAIAVEAINKTKEFFKSLGMPLTITEALEREPSDDELVELTELCTYNKTRTIGSLKQLDYDDILNIYRNIK